MDAQSQLAFEFQQLRDRIAQLEDRTLTVPVLDADPSADDPITVWLFADGRLNYRTPDGTVRSVTGTTTRTTTSGVAKPTPPVAAKSYDETLTCEWIACFDSTDNLCAYAGQIHYGRQKIMMGFANWRARLAGAEIRYAELIINSLYTRLPAGVRAHFGTHTVASMPATYSRKSRDNFTMILPNSGEIRFAVNAKFVEQLRDDVIDGFTIEQPEGLTAHSGYIDQAVQLRVAYVK